jgi:hypothetical protein
LLIYHRILTQELSDALRISPMSTKQPPSKSDLGAKVSIRLHEPGGGYRDLLGELITTRSVRKKDGSIHEFNPSEIAMWKIVPQKTPKNQPN